MVGDIAVISWRKLKDELTKYPDFIDLLPLSKAFLPLSHWLACNIVVRILSTYNHFMKDKFITANTINK